MYVAVNNINMFSFTTEIQQWIPIALFSTYQMFVLQLTTIIIKYYVWLYFCLILHENSTFSAPYPLVLCPV